MAAEVYYRLLEENGGNNGYCLVNTISIVGDENFWKSVWLHNDVNINNVTIIVSWNFRYQFTFSLSHYLHSLCQRSLPQFTILHNRSLKELPFVFLL